MRRLCLALLAALFAALAPMAAASAQAVDPGTAERDFVGRINALRAAKGLHGLQVHPELTSVARGWAAAMARADRISHNAGLRDAVQADWQKLGENVGVGMTVDRIHNAFVASPTHYRNLVETDFTQIGVGVVIGRDGALFTAHVFMQLRGGAKPAPTTSDPEPAAAEPQPAAAPSIPLAASGRLVLVLEQLRALDA